MRRIFTSFCMLFFALALGTAQTGQSSLAGKVLDDTGEPAISASVALYKGGALITGVLTDFDGNYSFSNIDPGTYEVEASYVGLNTQRVNGVIVYAGKVNKLDFELSAGVNLEEIVVTDYKVPLIEQDNTTRGGIKTGEEIRNLPTKNINALAATTAGLSSQDEGRAVNIRGSRSGATNYYLDGIRITGSLPPETEIDQLQVITGGFSAEIGDVTGGGVSITSKGASKNYSGQVELETSQYLDAFGYNMINGYVSGPIWKKGDGDPILGFRLSGRYRTREDDGPTATGVYVIKDEKLKEIEANPLERIGTNNVLVPTAEQISNDDVELLKTRPNEREKQLDVTSKLDFRFNKNIDLAITGTLNQLVDKFTPRFNNHGNNANLGGTDWTLLNNQYNPTNYDNTYRVLSRLRHRLGRSTNGSGEASSSVVQNASYYMQFAYEYNNSTNYDPRHEDRFFDYGHLGKFSYEHDTPSEGVVSYVVPNGNYNGTGDSTYAFYGHTGFETTFTGYDPSNSKNPGLSLYNALIPSDTEDDGAYLARNGFIPTNLTSIYGYFNNIHTVYNRYVKTEDKTVTFTGGLSFDLLPGGSAKGRHTMTIGAMYEQRDNRAYVISPNRLWVLAGLLANENIVGLDYLGGVVDSFESAVIPGLMLGKYALRSEDVEGQFWRAIREKLGVDENTYVDVDELNPDDMSLSLFSARELNDQGLLNYYGYNYRGDRLSGDVTFNSFWDKDPVTGERAYNVGAWRPTYLGMWVQDKFQFKDIIFRLGLRADRYDANTSVLKDQYALYDIMTADSYYSSVLQTSKPANIGDDYKVYVEQEGSTDIKSFRVGDQWYYPNGAPAPDGTAIYGTSTSTPYYKEQDANIRDIRSPDYKPETSFEDYKSKLFWVPRLAFSFPISDESNFFANYDVLVSRPTSNTIVTPLDYFYFEDQGRTPANNPNLQPERTIVYEVGFQQKLTNSSALRLSAYYRELRDLIQRRTVLYVPAPVSNYDTYGNIDFGTVKAFTIEYDLRRTNNVQINANYTLQFADGTGSDANSQNGLTNRGLNIRTLFPFSYDERHTFNMVMDYRYGRGKKYNGPRVMGADIFQDAGINLQASAVSGRPYTKNLVPTTFGGSGNSGTINGNRLPWRFNLDMRIDKRFDLTNKNIENAHPLWLNAYLRVQNVFDIQNVLGVYSASGSADDDGFLTSTFGEGAVNTLSDSGRDPSYYLDVYSWAVLNPGFFNLPRRIFLGAIFEF
ncbi:MAG: carboxypeptidase regulatory-like domain-containing protein [Saprospiraceae bacterium]|nr:carboxypeptidase regulatory-like domain-containing protein [Saprospiraceae bacterium]